MSRKKKWKGIPLNKTNIDEYMSDLYEDTKGQYITQGVSFNKDDSFQMNLLKNALLSHGSFSGFIKHLMYNYFETNNKLEDSIWIPNGNKTDTPQSPTLIEQEIFQEQNPKTEEAKVEEQENPVSPTPPKENKQNPQRPRMRNGSLKQALLESKPVE